MYKPAQHKEPEHRSHDEKKRGLEDPTLNELAQTRDKYAANRCNDVT
jgi:hypothetical protein